MLNHRLLRVGEHAFLGFQPLVFASLRLAFFDFALLKHPQVYQPQAVLLALLQLFDAAANSLPRFVGCRYRFDLAARKSIQQPEPCWTVE